MSPAARRRAVRKARRVQLAKSELLLHLAVTVERWSREYADAEPGVLPMAQWGPLPNGRTDPMVALLSTYGLSQADLSKVCSELGDELEARAMRAGYDDHWDPDEETA